MAGNDAVVVNELCHSYGDRQALKNVSFTAAARETFGLLGPNGGGKTTTFRILSTSLRASGGTATIFGDDVASRPDAVRRSIGVVFQSPSLDKKLTVLENLIHQGHLYGLSGRELQQRAAELLDRVGMQDRAKEKVESLSGGLKRRVELAKGLLHRPRLLLLDEPSTGLDPGARIDMWEYLARLQESDGVTVLVTTHLMEEAAKCHHLGILDEGSLVAAGSPEELCREVGGDVLIVESESADSLAPKIRERFGGEPKVLDGQVRFEREEGHRFVPELIEAFPGEIEAVYFGKPTLEDVFIRRTGHRFWTEEAAS